MGKEIILEILDVQNTNSLIAFTDGSCKGNPGPCGAGAVIYKGEEEIKLKKAVSKHVSILLGELIAVKLVLDHALSSNTLTGPENLAIFL